MITATAPGKLYIAGEYAVVTPGYPAILVAVDRTVTVTLTSTQATTGTITSDQDERARVTWQTTPNGTITSTPASHPFPYVTAALEMVLRLAQERELEIRPVNLHVTSTLDDAAGKKYGLGSSAAVTVATVKARPATTTLRSLKPRCLSWQPSRPTGFRATAPSATLLPVPSAAGLPTRRATGNG